MPQNNKPPVDTIQMERLDHTKRAQNGHPSHVQDNVCCVLGTDSPAGIKKSLYEKNGVAMCSQKRALFIATIVFATLFATSLIIAYTGPQSDCSCAGEKPANFVDKDWNATKNFVPIASNGQVFPWNNVRLPNFIRPSRYNITIRPNLTTLEVKGQVNIEFHLEKDSNFIVFHSKNLTITDKLLQDKKGHHLKIIKLLEYPRAEQMYLEIKDKFRKRDNYTLSLRYSTRLSRDLEGFYISSYMGSDGEKRYLATTHFEPTYARSAFPCFDEPQLKARFKISIFRDRFHIALCNMPVINTEDTGFYMGTGLLRDVFQESVEMSTYLVAFVVCDYTHVSRKTENNVFVSVYVSKGLIDQTVFALDTATKLMDYFENFFMVPYPLPKQDLIAIPDFAAGAMENWGLITYRETAILYDPVETSTAAHQWIAIVITHELAHQWFGNLVTMKWWNDLWLNEGFSSFLEYLGVDAIYPEWRMMEQFILDKTQSALQLDALASSHPISVSVHDPTEIEAIFDTISYNKGAAILYMLEKFLTRDTLRDGLKDYLNLYKYSNAETKDLWNVFSKHSNQSLEVKAIMDTWTQQMGYPLIRIVRNGNKFNITQERFLMISEINNSSNKSENSPLEHKWFVPLSYFTDREPYVTYNIWMNMSDATLEVSEDVQWIKVNVNQTGFYRVMYDESTMAEIITILKENHTFFSPADRANLIDDIFTLSRAGFLNTSLSLDLSLYLIKERDYVPWATAIKHLQTWSRCLLESNSYQRFLLYIRKLIEPVVEYVGWEDEGSHLKKLLRADILGLAVLAEMDSAVKEAISRFKRWMTDAEKIPPNLREVVYSAGVKYGGLAEWEHCWAKYNSTEISSERKLLLKAMGVASDPWLLQRYLMATLQRDLVKPQNVKILMSVVAANPKGQLLAWRHLKAYWSEMQSLFGNNTFPMGGLVSVVTSHLSSPYDYHEVSSYFKGIEMGSASRALDQSLERIRLNINWVKSNENEISEWLHEYLNSLK